MWPRRTPLALAALAICLSSAAMPHARVSMLRLERGITFPTSDACRRVLEGVLNDYMALQYGVNTPYTAGRAVLPSDTTADDLEAAYSDPSTEPHFKSLFKAILDKFRSGDMTPEVNDGTWDAKYTPVLVLVSPKVSPE